MSYKERSVWVSLAITLYIWWNYFSDIYFAAEQGRLTIDVMQSALIAVVAMTILLEIAHHIVIAIIDNKNANYDEDERDKQISLLGSRNAYFILSFTIVLAILHLLSPIMNQALVERLSLPQEYVVINIIILGALFAEVVKFSTQIFYYRRGF